MLKLRTREPHNNPTRPAFTLLEVLMALGLTTLLVAAVYKALDLHWSYQTAGREQVERSQVARAILQRMTSDLKSIVFIEPEEDVGTSEEDDETDATEVDDTTSDDPLEGTTIGLTGTTDKLQILVSKPTRMVTGNFSGEVDDVLTIAGQLKTVSYFLADTGGGGLQGAVANLSTTTPANSIGVQGLARLEAERAAVDFADQQMDLNGLAQSAQVLAHEVVSLQFKYFDGVNWLDAWDSSAYVEKSVEGELEEVIAGLPQAVEITLGLRNEEDTDPGVADQTYRLVVSLPIAKKNVDAVGL